MLKKAIAWVCSIAAWMGLVYVLSDLGRDDLIGPIFIGGLVLYITYLVFDEIHKAQASREAARELNLAALDTQHPFDAGLIDQTKFWPVARPRFRNVCRGRVGKANVTIAEGYTLSFVGSASMTVAAFEFDDVEFPPFHVIPEVFTTRMDGLLHIQKLDFSSNPEFSRRYRAQGEDELTIRRILNVDVLSMILEGEVVDAWAIAGVHHWLFLGHPLGNSATKNLRKFLEDSSRLASAMHHSSCRASEFAEQR